MQKKTSNILKVVLVLIIIGFGAVIYYIYNALPIGTGYTAKYLCSSVFITGRGETETIEEDILPGNILYDLYRRMCYLFSAWMIFTPFVKRGVEFISVNPASAAFFSVSLAI